MLADQLDYVVGVDPHRDSHALAVVDVVSGAVVFEAAALPRVATVTRTPSSSSISTRRVDARSLLRAPGRAHAA